MSAAGRRLGRTRWGREAALAVVGLAMLLPFAELFVGALRTPAERVMQPPQFWPPNPTFDNFARAIGELPLLTWGINSLVVTASITALQLAISAAAGFALAKYSFRGNRALLQVVLGAQVLPFFLLLIPLFFVMRYWPLAGGNGLVTFAGDGLLGSYASLVLPFAVSWFGIFMMRQYMMAIPDELLDAARIDGASELGILVRLAVPLVRPGLVTLGLFVFVYHWNEFLWTATITRTAPELMTLPVGIHLMQDVFKTPSGEAMRQATLALSTLPLLVLFVVAQRFYGGGGVNAGLKG